MPRAVMVPRGLKKHWRLMNRVPIGSCRAYGGSSGRQWTVVEGQYYAIAVRTQLKLTVHATGGAPAARVFEIRVYDEQK